MEMEMEKEQKKKKRLERSSQIKSSIPDEDKNEISQSERQKRKCYSFYCTSDEILYLRSLLKKMRRFINSMEPTNITEYKKESEKE